MRTMVIVTAWCLMASVAVAQQLGDECVSNADCAAGLSCDELGASDCASVTCPDGEACEEPEPCDSTPEKACVPAACSVDADCGTDLNCVIFESTSCSTTSDTGGGSTDPAPPPEEEDGEEDPECTTETFSVCAPSWAGSCNVNADCGAGFACVDEEICTGGGSTGGGTSDPPPLPDEDGEEEDDCAPTGERYCEPLEMPCESDASCPADWSCEQSPSAGGVCMSDSETGEVVCDEPEPGPSSCWPPGWGAWNGGSDREATLNSGSDPASDNNEQGAGSNSEASSQDDVTTRRDDAGCATSGLSVFMLLGLFLRRRRK